MSPPPRTFASASVVVIIYIGANQLARPTFSSFAAILHADAPVLNRRRAYRLEIGRDLLVDWWVEVTFGRIGRAGRTMRFAARDEVEAREILLACLARRMSAPRRIGVGYEERSWFDPQGWGASFRGAMSTRPRPARPQRPSPPLALSGRRVRRSDRLSWRDLNLAFTILRHGQQVEVSTRPQLDLPGCGRSHMWRAPRAHLRTCRPAEGSACRPEEVST